MIIQGKQGGGSLKITNMAYSNMENRIKKYYKNLNLVKAKKIQKESYIKRLERIEKDYNRLNKSIRLNSDLQGVTYDRVIVSGGSLPMSDMDKQVESIFKKFEQDIVNLYERVFTTECEVRALEGNNDKLNELLNLLSDESQKVIELKYNQNYSYERIAEEVPMSKANVYRKIKLILKELYSYDELKK